MNGSAWKKPGAKAAERRVGELMEAQRDAGLLRVGGDGSNQHQQWVAERPKAPTLAEAGIDKHLADRARKLAPTLIRFLKTADALQFRSLANCRELQRNAFYLLPHRAYAFLQPEAKMKERIFETDLRLRIDHRLRSALEAAARREATTVSEFVRSHLRQNPTVGAELSRGSVEQGSSRSQG